jgi:hypothetical protein
MPSDARENNSAANRNTNSTALRIIIDSPSYYMIFTQPPFMTWILESPQFSHFTDLITLTILHATDNAAFKNYLDSFGLKF